MTTKNKKITSKEAKKEFEKCRDDIVYFIRNYANILTQDKGVVPFDLWDFQEDFIRKYILGFIETGDYRYLQVIKSRQLGMSTVLGAVITWMANFQKGKTIAIIATDLTTAQELFQKAMLIYDAMPSFLKIGLKKRTEKEIRFKNYSRIKAYPHDKKRGIRSITCYFAVIDEAAIIDGADDMWTAVYPAIESSGGQAVILSTPYGPDGWFYDIYTKTIKGELDFHVVRMDWTLHPKRNQEWRDAQDRIMGKRKASQEYDAKFGVSGDTYFDPDVIELIEKKQISDQFETKGRAKIFEHPRPNEEYIAGVDCAEGGGDSNTIIICKKSTLEQVFEFESKETYETFGFKVFEWCSYYNDCLACIEANAVGTSIIQRMNDLSYPNLYFRGSLGEKELVGVQKAKAGWKTTPKTRPILIENMRKFLESVDDISVIIKSESLLNEMKTFIVKNGKPQAKSGATDDLVMALGILLIVYTFAGTGNTNKEKTEEYIQMMMEVNRNMKKNFQKNLTNDDGNKDLNRDKINEHQLTLEEREKYKKNKRKANLLQNKMEKRMKKQFDWVL